MRMPETDNTAGDLPKEESRATSEQARAAKRVPLTDEQILAAHVGELAPLVGPIHIVDYDPEWPQLFEREAKRIQAALGNRVVLIEHVGSTSVPGLAAKPRIDVLLVVADSADEPAYLPALEPAAHVLPIPHPDCYEHRMFNGPDTDVNLHFFSPGSPEIDRKLLVRDWLRSNTSARQLNELTKRAVPPKDW